ncbi:hypothetical protein [Sinomonas sp. G460-2]|uniref:hypothetical protein n=1 Tax=Sinomonas sp. G460-2 TaxID=3393464 RepID=UPI0039EEE031
MTEAPRNPALDEIAFFLGVWEMTLSNADFLPDPGQTAVGRAEFGLLEEGSLVVMRQFIDPDAPAAARWVIGRDDCRPEYTVLYADARGVSRVYRMSLEEDVWRVWRDDPAFSQRFEAQVAEDRRTMSGTWEKRSAGGDWEHDFDIDFVRLNADGAGT